VSIEIFRYKKSKSVKNSAPYSVISYYYYNIVFYYFCGVIKYYNIFSVLSVLILLDIKNIRPAKGDNMKNPTMLSIREFAKYTGVKQSTLRFYDEIGLLSPAGRGEENNYRYYRPNQSMTVSFINVLIDLGVPLAEIKEMSELRTPEYVIELLSKQEVILDRKLNELHAAYSIIHTFRKNIQTGLIAHDGEVKTERLDDAYFILGPVNDFTDGQTFYEPFMNFRDKAKDFRINLSYPIGGYHYDMDSFLRAPGQPDKFFSLDPTGNCTREPGEYLVGYTRGYYGEFGALPQKMASYAKERGLVCFGPVYTEYPLDEISVSQPDRYLARLFVSVSDNRAKFKKDTAKNCPVRQACVRPHCEDNAEVKLHITTDSSVKPHAHASKFLNTP
jgi:DNA-binding transcriptional MerR regulator